MCLVCWKKDYVQTFGKISYCTVCLSMSFMCSVDDMWFCFQCYTLRVTIATEDTCVYMCIEGWVLSSMFAHGIVVYAPWHVVNVSCLSSGKRNSYCVVLLLPTLLHFLLSASLQLKLQRCTCLRVTLLSISSNLCFLPQDDFDICM